MVIGPIDLARAQITHPITDSRRTHTRARSSSDLNSHDRNNPNCCPCTSSSVASKSSTMRLDTREFEAMNFSARTSCSRTASAQPARCSNRHRGSGAGQRPILLHRRQQRQVPAQLIVVLQILVTQCEAIDPLANDQNGIVDATDLPTCLAQRLRRPLS